MLSRGSCSRSLSLPHGPEFVLPPLFGILRCFTVAAHSRPVVLRVFAGSDDDDAERRTDDGGWTLEVQLSRRK